MTLGNGDMPVLLLQFRAGYRLHVPTGACGMHQHATFELVYRQRGRGVTLTGEGVRFAFEQGALSLYPPRCDHDQMNETVGEDWCIHGAIDGTIPPELRRSLHLPLSGDPAVQMELAQLTQGPSSVRPWLQQAFNCRLSAIVCHVLDVHEQTRTQRLATPADAYIDAAQHYIAERFLSITRMEEIAEHVGISYDYLRHLFREKTGQRLIDYLTHQRIERARQLLTLTSLPIKSIARLSGFTDERYLSTTFRRLVGAAPGAYRRRMTDPPAAWPHPEKMV